MNGEDETRPVKKSKSASRQKAGPDADRSGLMEAETANLVVEDAKEESNDAQADSMDVTESISNEATKEWIAPVEGSDEPDRKLESSSPAVDN